MPIDGDLQITQSGFPPTTHSAEEAMYMWETHGKMVPVAEDQQELFQLYRIGKEQRDFHVTEWRGSIKQYLALPEEFYGVLGMVSPSEFRGVFGRDLDLHLLSIQARELREEIRFYEDWLRSEDSCSMFKKRCKSRAYRPQNLISPELEKEHQ